MNRLFFFSRAIRTPQACPMCRGDAFWIEGVSVQWRCLSCGAFLIIEPDEEEDPYLDVFKETVEKIDASKD